MLLLSSIRNESEEKKFCWRVSKVFPSLLRNRKTDRTKEINVFIVKRFLSFLWNLFFDIVVVVVVWNEAIFIILMKIICMKCLLVSCDKCFSSFHSYDNCFFKILLLLLSINVYHSFENYLYKDVSVYWCLKSCDKCFSFLWKLFDILVVNAIISVLHYNSKFVCVMMIVLFLLLQIHL